MEFKDMEDISRGKTYMVANRNDLKSIIYAKKDGLLYHMANLTFSNLTNDIISTLQFEEIKQPMTIIEAVEWMNEKPLENKAMFHGVLYLMNFSKDLIYEGYKNHASVNCEMITGQWYKA